MVVDGDVETNAELHNTTVPATQLAPPTQQVPSTSASSGGAHVQAIQKATQDEAEKKRKEEDRQKLRLSVIAKTRAALALGNERGLEAQ